MRLEKSKTSLVSSTEDESILSSILDESTSDDSEKDFKDFMQIFVSRKVATRKPSLCIKRKSKELCKPSENSPKIPNKKGHSEKVEEISIEVSNTLKVHSKRMHYRSNSAGRNASACYYPYDFYKKYKSPRRDPKSQLLYLSGVSYCVDNQSKYRANRQRSLSPNLPKIPYLNKPPQYNSPATPTQRRTRLIFKNRSYKESSKVNKNGSKKSIPDHALMKSLLSGLSIFDNEDEVRGSHSKNLHKNKSMGNIKSSTTENYTLRGTCKSNVDFADSSMNHCEETYGNFKDCCTSYKQGNPKGCLKKEKDESCRFDNGCRYERFSNEHNTNFSHEKGDINYRQQILPDHKPQRCNTLVERRKHFFENRKRQIELENVKMRPTLAISCIERQIQNEFEKSDEITEIYRNFRSVQSTSTLSKRSSSLPPSRFKRCNMKNSDLFNPDYNFNCENNSNNALFRNSIIESIRSKVFQTNTNAKTEADDSWNSEPTFLPKFPKETRTAMSIILSNKNSSISCKICREKFRKTQLSHSETQTSPQTSQHQIVPKLSEDASKLPCPKNLLCDRGHHHGRCEESVRRKLDVVCDEHCDCRENRKNRMMIGYTDEPSWPGQAVRLQEDGGPWPEDFLGIIRPDLDTSEESIACQRIESPTQPPTTMNGLNGHTNGDLNGCGDIITQNQQRGCWTIGLINSKYKYLTAETFGFKINANGASLKKKQIWTLEPDTSSGNDTCVYLKSHLDKYLAVDSFGNVTCESEVKEPGSKFQVTVAEDNTGRWAFRNVVRGYFLGSSADKLTCTAKAPGDSEYWHIHLAARPQVNLRSVGRKRFAHLSENLDEIHVDANIPWGEDTLFTLEFHADEDGKYALHTCNNKYLSNGGKLVDTCNKDCLFSAEYHSGQLALRDRNGQYLSPIGSKAVLKTRSNTVTKDELFSLEDSLPQASFVAALNSRYVSVKQGVDVTANQDEISDHEMFQLEFDWSTKRWYIRTMQDKYWTLETGGGIQASGDKRSSNALFDLVWQGDGSLAFRANNGRYVITKRSGHLYAISDVIDENCKYYFYLINRPILVLKCEQGFVGYKSASSPKLECNKATYECIQVERSEKGIIHFKGQNGKFWHVDSEGVTADSDAPEGFYLELREPTRLCIKAANGNYLTASKNGLFRLGDSAFENATQWEY